MSQKVLPFEENFIKIKLTSNDKQKTPLNKSYYLISVINDNYLALFSSFPSLSSKPEEIFEKSKITNLEKNVDNQTIEFDYPQKTRF